MEQCSTLLQPLAGWSLIDALSADESRSRLNDTDVAQPAIFALQVALAAVWEAWGVVPAAVVGHSVGELAAAVVAEAMSLDEAIRVAYHRARLMQQATGGGKMAAVELDAGEAARVVRPFAGRLSIAAVNAATSCVLSGEASALETVTAELQSRGIACRPLPVNYAFHSVQMEAIARQLESTLGTVAARTPRIPLVSTVTGKIVSDGALDAAYWARNVRQSVLFAPAIDTLAERGYRLFVEVGPHPVLASSITSPGRRAAPRVALPSLHRGRPEQASLLATLGGLYAAGYPIDWRRIYPSGRAVALPRYPWQRESYWLPEPDLLAAHGPTAEPQQDATADAMPLAGRRVRSPHLRGSVFESALSDRSPEWLADHLIAGVPVVPAAAFLAMAAWAAEQAAGAPASVEDIFIHRPLSLKAGDVRTVQTIVMPAEAGFTLEIYSMESSGPGRPDLARPDGEWTLHVTGRVTPDGLGGGTSEPREDVHARCLDELAVDAHYDGLLRHGASLGPMLRTVTRLLGGDGESLGYCALPPALIHESARYPLHPAVIDGCLQPVLAALPVGDPRRKNSYLPQTVGRLRLMRAADGPVLSHATLRANRDDRDARIVADVRVMDRDGGLVALLEGVGFASASAPRDVRRDDTRRDDYMYASEWVASPGGAPTSTFSSGGKWLVLIDRQGVGESLARSLESLGQACIRIGPDIGARLEDPSRLCVDPGDPDDMERVCGEIVAACGPLEGVVHLWSLDVATVAGDSAEQVESGQRIVCGSALAVVKALARRETATRPRLLLVTSGAQSTGAGETVALAQASLWGLARVVSLEHPDLSCRCIDLDPRASAAEGAAALIACLQTSGDEPELAVRSGRPLRRRLTRRMPAHDRHGRPEGETPSTAARALDIEVRGALDNLALRPLDRVTPAAGEIEIEVRASGLNFRDVLNALGMYPGGAGRPGSECAGVVCAIGSGVSGWQTGDEVMALADGAMATHVVTPAGRAVRKPAGLTFEQAATLPIAFLTAEYALHDLARLAPGERVLIHAAAGGVGLAAVQIAQRIGAEVYATAGSPEKHRFLHALGVQHVFSSRSLDFAHQIHDASGGRGVDVAVNSLAGDFIPKTLGAMAPGGRFVEIGKTGIWDARQVRAARPDVSYHALYLGEIFERDPARTQEMLGDLVQSIEAGSLRPLPLEVFDLEDAAAAFRHMAQARHIGKVALSSPAAGPARHRPVGITPVATYLVTGGLGSLGLHVARWLVDAGARHLVLVGRRAPSASSSQAMAALDAAGGQVVVIEADVARRADVDRVIAHISRSMPPLKGVVHAAGILDDGVVIEQQWTRFESVMRPKVLGAWNLHEATRDTRLDFFVCFSSIASTLGSPGQSNYAAANAMLDALAHHRRSLGLPALSINWGPWTDGGMAAAASGQMTQRWADRGLHGLSPEEALKGLADAMNGDDAQVIVARIDWAGFARQFTPAPSLIRQLVADPPAAATAPPPARLADVLNSAPPIRRMSMLVDYVLKQALRVLGLPGSYPLEPEQGLRDVGLDSLMAVELRNQLQAGTDAHLPTTLAFDFPTVNAIASHLAAVMSLDTGNATVPAVESSVDSFAEQLGDLSDAEAEALLNAELSGAHQSPTGGP